mgnify:CR=1 FL=1
MMNQEQQYKDCIEACLQCMNACNVCYVSSLKEYELAMLRECIRLDRECADICSYLEAAITRNSPFVSQLAKVCAEICEACAKECRKHDHDHCQKCAEACQKCAEACRNAA